RQPGRRRRPTSRSRLRASAGSAVWKTTGSRCRPRQRGVTLVELMVAMLLGLILTGGAIQVFIGNRAAYDFNEGLARLQENGRFAIDSLSFRTRMAGYFGCLPDIPIHNNL